MTAHAPVGTARFERVLRLRRRVWDALTTTASLVRWFIRATIEPRVGGVASFDPARGLRLAP